MDETDLEMKYLVLKIEDIKKYLDQRQRVIFWIFVKIIIDSKNLEREQEKIK